MLIGLIDVGFDPLHHAFLDPAGNSRVIEIWDQHDPTGPHPRDVHPNLDADYGSVHTASDIQSYLVANALPARLTRDLSGHGTHVASIAAGRAVGQFGGGIAPAAKLIVVIPKITVGSRDLHSIGYSQSHMDALAYIREVAQSRQEPVVVNVSLGMNAGAHDGRSALEAAFDAFSGLGREPGLVIVKSAGNERGMGGHARLALSPNTKEVLRWTSRPIDRPEDVSQLWFRARDEIRFRLHSPGGDQTEQCDWAAQVITGSFGSGNSYQLSYQRRHQDNGDSCLLLVIRRGTATAIETGEWKLEIVSGQLLSDGIVHAWLERDESRPVSFSNHCDDDFTITIPGTAQSVITVAAVGSSTPLQNTPTSSRGPTRDLREKPDLVAPGLSVQAAQADTRTGVVAMSGTSMAAPHVTGAIALLLSRKAKTGPPVSIPNANQIQRALCDGAQFANGLYARGNGYGLLDAEALMAAFP